MAGRRIVITGGSGFVGRMLRKGLAEAGYAIDIFDSRRGLTADLLRTRFLGTSTQRLPRKLARGLRRYQKRAEGWLESRGAVKASGDDILDSRERLAERFRGAHAVLHLAGLPHPNVPGASDADFERINYDGSINVFRAAEAAGVAKFVFASSAQVYRINQPVRIDQFPILETNYLPTREDGLHAYGFLKRKFEAWMAEAARSSPMQASALRLEFPGMRSTSPRNLYIGTSVENLVGGFAAALADSRSSGEAFNLADAEVDREIVDIQTFLAQTWPGVVNHTRGNEGLLSIDKARRILGYSPAPGGHYFDASLVF